MGYQIGVTPLQMVAAVSAIANGGELVEPRVVGAVYRDSRRYPVTPKVVRRTISADTAATLTTIMEGVVERGTAKAAQIPGYTVAGKTGTAHKLVDGRYSKSDYNASFVGFIPSRDPAVAIIVVIDSPHAGTYYGGSVVGADLQAHRRSDDAAPRRFRRRSIRRRPVLVARATAMRRHAIRSTSRRDADRRHHRADAARHGARCRRHERTRRDADAGAARRVTAPRRRRLRDVADTRGRRASRARAPSAGWCSAACRISRDQNSTTQP